MATPSRPRLFLDASLLVAAARSPQGGSATVLQLCAHGLCRAIVTEKVLLEARVNIAEKFGAAELARFYEQLASAKPEIAPPPSEDAVRRCQPLTTAKDVHVLAAAIDSKASHLLTLDRRHLLTPAIQRAGLSFAVLTPGDFLKAFVANL
ncbi:MAG: PIN domain-containing protein [Chloroflexi bacterium]|nr:PIN domain-containing protein [Chloroflexota bacterium]